ncbi:alpha/beta hydrolase [Streptomyces sp. NBC_01288]|uniref:alpha/beta fold hydrolase n=1 Tax=Streptomyces sp. NBC_01288 TaxID=2903814 RepID=UPI002E10DE2D|nr:alpha/beta hydrolase [Streptomyces sp. NBC_01288]
MTWAEVGAGIRLKLSDRGAADGPALVLVHGWKGSHRMWDRLSYRLRNDFRVVSYDLRGMGESDKPRAAYSFTEMADDLTAVLEQLDIQDATLVGSSMGCSVVLEYMRRSAARVARVVLNNGPIMLTTRDDFKWAMPPEQLNGYLDDIEQRWPLSEWDDLGDEPLDPARRISSYLTALQTPMDIALAVVRQQATLDHRDAVRNMPVPVLAAYSVRDPFYPPELAKWIADSAPQGSFELFHESGHATPYEEPEKFAQVIRAFAGIDGGPPDS